MDDTARLEFLAARVQNLVREKEAALAALESASRLGHFDTSYSALDGPEPILQEIASRAGELLPMPAAAVYLIDEASQDVVLSLRRGQADGFDPEAEVEALIADHSFSFALGRRGPTFFETATARGRLLLHPLATPSRVRGMFVGLVHGPAGQVTDTALALLTVVVNAGAQALESYALYRHMREVNAALEEKVASRTAELRQAYDQVRLVIDAMPAGVVVIDARDHSIIDINPAGLAMIGLTRETVVGRTCFDCFCPAQRGACPIVDFGQDVVSVERTVRCAAGRVVPILKTAVRATLGGRPCVVESFIDISEQKKLAELREDVERMTRHDLKSPLTGIIGLPEIMLDDPDFPPGYREYVALVKEAGLKMLGMINLSLDLYKMETGTYNLDPRPVDLAGVLGGVVRDLEPLTRAKGLTVVFETNGVAGLHGPVMALGETLLFVSLFSNLLKNAAEASPRGGVVRVALAGRDRVWASIHNAGAVPEAVRDRFFEKYATAGKSGGTGLGAYSARLIVDNLGGEIDFLSNEEAGTTLFLSIPRPG
jgi:PAS domain S-box-containing protein